MNRNLTPSINDDWKPNPNTEAGREEIRALVRWGIRENLIGFRREPVQPGSWFTLPAAQPTKIQSLAEL